MNTKRLAAGLLFGLSVISAAAQAQAPTIRFQDDDIDFLLNPTTLTPKTGAWAVGDVLVSVFEIPTYTLNGVSQIGAGNEITGIAVLQVQSIVGSTVTFQAYTGGFNDVSPVDVVNGGAGGGTTVAVWRNGTAGGADTNLDLDFGSNPAASCTSLANCLQQASLGGLVQVDGFGGDPNEFWAATGTIAGAFNTNTVLATGGGLQVASFNAAQTTFFNELGPVANMDVLGQTPCVGGGGPLGCVFGPTIAGGISGGGGTTPLNAGIVADGAFARSDIDGTKLLAVPEPGMLTLLGVVLLGLGATRRRRQ